MTGPPRTERPLHLWAKQTNPKGQTARVRLLWCPGLAFPENFPEHFCDLSSRCSLLPPVSHLGSHSGDLGSLDRPSLGAGEGADTGQP